MNFDRERLNTENVNFRPKKVVQKFKQAQSNNESTDTCIYAIYQTIDKLLSIRNYNYSKYTQPMDLSKNDYEEITRKTAGDNYMKLFFLSNSKYSRKTG